MSCHVCLCVCISFFYFLPPLIFLSSIFAMREKNDKDHFDAIYIFFLLSFAICAVHCSSFCAIWIDSSVHFSFLLILFMTIQNAERKKKRLQRFCRIVLIINSRSSLLVEKLMYNEKKTHGFILIKALINIWHISHSHSTGLCSINAAINDILRTFFL